MRHEIRVSGRILREYPTQADAERDYETLRQYIFETLPQEQVSASFINISLEESAETFVDMYGDTWYVE